ncbi:hypothetical protein ACRALDRAFT_205496 [Sodiomyces alcalophilus JCM 7366]|uniref:uncharacterized protein n=1 Tax=Sodiomyces alcalophilus JCM 7366 TaxID=591952 RepID=UPI0039B66611
MVKYSLPSQSQRQPNRDPTSMLNLLRLEQAVSLLRQIPPCIYTRGTRQRNDSKDGACVTFQSIQCFQHCIVCIVSRRLQLGRQSWFTTATSQHPRFTFEDCHLHTQQLQTTNREIMLRSPSSYSRRRIFKASINSDAATLYHWTTSPIEFSVRHNKARPATKAQRQGKPSIKPELTIETVYKVRVSTSFCFLLPFDNVTAFWHHKYKLSSVTCVLDEYSFWTGPIEVQGSVCDPIGIEGTTYNSFTVTDHFLRLPPLLHSRFPPHPAWKKPFHPAYGIHPPFSLNSICSVLT